MITNKQIKKQIIAMYAQELDEYIEQLDSNLSSKEVNTIICSLEFGIHILSEMGDSYETNQLTKEYETILSLYKSKLQL